MSAELKDASDVYKKFGAAPLLEAAESSVTFVPKSVAVARTGTQSNGSEERPKFQWSVLDAAETWTADPESLAAMADPPIIEGLLREKEVAVVVGQAKTAKTWFALHLSLCVAAGHRFLDHATRQCKVLYLDYELKTGTFTRRMSMLSPDMPDGFHYQCLRGSDTLPTIADITELVKQGGFGLVVVDSLYRTGWLSEENNNDSTARDLTKLQTFTKDTNCSLVVVDHTAKGGGAERSTVDAARGASAKGGFFDALLLLRPTDKGPDPQQTYAVLDPVLRDWPRFQELPLIAFNWTATTASVEVAGEVARNEVDSYSTKILEALERAKGPLTIKEIAFEIGQDTRKARRRIDTLIAGRRVVTGASTAHKQALVYRLPDMVDPTGQNPTKP